MSLKPYPEYKGNHSRLLGDLPIHWAVSRLRSALNVKKEIVGSSWSEHLLLSLTLQGVIPRDMENRIGKLPADFTTYQRVGRGDLIFCLFDVEETPRTVGWVPEDGMLTGAYTAASVSRNFDARYVAYHYLSYDQRKSLRGYYAGLRNTIRSADFASIPIALPPIDEQQTIVQYLDSETAEIDAFIGDQELLISLLSERRKAAITHVLSKSYENSKDIRMRYIAEINPSAPYLIRLKSETFIDFIPMDSIREFGGFNLSQKRMVAEVQAGYSYFEDGDLIFAKVTPCFENGKSAVLEGLAQAFGFGTTEVTVLRPNSMVDARFLLYAVLEDRFRQLGKASMTGAGGLKRVNETFTRDYRLLLPPIADQVEIVAILDQEMKEIDAMVSDAREAIALSKERRAAVISAAVTGKIDVRGFAPPAATNVEVDSVGVA